MGMYTQLRMDVELNIKEGDTAFDVLQYMLGYSNKVPDPIPDHPLFETERWSWMLKGASYYFGAPISRSEMIYDEISDHTRSNTENGWYLLVDCSFKNYDSEIEKFLDWLIPHINAYEGDFLGYHMYEEYIYPTLIYYKEKPTSSHFSNEPQYHILE